MIPSFHPCQLHWGFWHLAESSFLCFLPFPRSWLNPDDLRVQLGLSFTLITQGNLLSRAFSTRPCSLCVCSDLDIIWNDSVSDFCYLTIISYLPTVTLNPTTPTLPHCRIFHTLESFHFSFLAALPWPQSFLLCSIDSTFHCFKYFEYFISSSLLSSSNYPLQTHGLIIASLIPPLLHTLSFPSALFTLHCVYTRLRFPLC